MSLVTVLTRWKNRVRAKSKWIICTRKRSFVLTKHHSNSISLMSASDYRRMKVKCKQTYFHLGCVQLVTCLLGLCCVLMGICHRVSV